MLKARNSLPVVRNVLQLKGATFTDAYLDEVWTYSIYAVLLLPLNTFTINISVALCSLLMKFALKSNNISEIMIARKSHRPTL